MDSDFVYLTTRINGVEVKVSHYETPNFLTGKPGKISKHKFFEIMDSFESAVCAAASASEREDWK